MYKDLSNYDIAMDIYQKIMHAKTTVKNGHIYYDDNQEHINIAEIVEYLFMHKMNDKTPIHHTVVGGDGKVKHTWIFQNNN